MAHDAFIRFEGIDARVDQGDQRGWARLLAFRHVISQPGAGGAAAAGDAGPGRAEHGDFVVLKAADEASPRLALMCCNGFRIPTVIVAIHDSAGLRQKIMEYRMTDVMVRAFNPFLQESKESSEDREGQGGRMVQEEVALRYRRIVWGFTLVSGNAARGEVRTYWDLQGNTGG
jgi:type VI secretion system Hcp family effector